MKLYAFTRRDRRTDTEREADLQAEMSRPPLDPVDRADIAYRHRTPGPLSFWCSVTAHSDCGHHGALVASCVCDCHTYMR